MTSAAGKKSPSPGQFTVVGTRPLRHDGVDKVTGHAQYGADVHLPGLLHGKVLRSPHAHARIRAIDTSHAEALPGVQAVATARDFPLTEDRVIDFAEVQGNTRMMAENILAHAKVLYKGHAVAAVAAPRPHNAEEALTRIAVDYEVLPAVLNVHDAMKKDAPLLHEHMTTRFRVERFERGQDTRAQSNIAGHLQFQRGDLEQGFREAAVIVEREFSTQTVHQGYIEPHASTASWASDGHLTLWTSTQGPFAIRTATAAILNIPESMVQVIPLEIGGGFGATLVAYLDPVAAMLSRKSGRPVKMVMDRKEVFEGTGPTSATFMRCKIGATRDGRITAAQLSLVYERPAGQDGHGPQGSLRGDRAHLGDLHAVQDRGHPGRAHHRRPALSRL